MILLPKERSCNYINGVKPHPTIHIHGDTTEIWPAGRVTVEVVNLSYSVSLFVHFKFNSSVLLCEQFFTLTAMKVMTYIYVVCVAFI